MVTRRKDSSRVSAVTLRSMVSSVMFMFAGGADSSALAGAVGLPAAAKVPSTYYGSLGVQGNFLLHPKAGCRSDCEHSVASVHAPRLR